MYFQIWFLFCRQLLFCHRTSERKWTPFLSGRTPLSKRSKNCPQTSPSYQRRSVCYCLVPLLLLHCWVIVRYMHKNKGTCMRIYVERPAERFLQISNSWITCIKIYLYIYLVIIYIFFFGCKKWRNTCKAIVKDIDIPWNNCFWLFYSLIQLYALQEKQTLMKTDMDSRFTSESEARYIYL